MDELKDVWHEYVAIKAASLKLSLWRGVVAAATIVFAITFGIGVMITATAFTLFGIAGWLGEATSKPYIGFLAAGLFGLLMVGSAIVAVRAFVSKSGHHRD